MNTEEHELSRFRQTVLKHLWKESYQIASTLFAKNVPQCTILIANQMKRSYLRFRSRYDLEWVASFAHDVIILIQEGHEELGFPDEANETFADAPHGTTNLIGGVEELWNSVMVARAANEKAKHLATALNNFIIAEIGYYWEVVHPDEMQLHEMFWDAPSTGDGKKILPPGVDKEKMYRGIGFLKQPESIGYHSARLMNIADEIELILRE